MKIVCEERSDEGLRLFKDGCCGTIRTIDGGGDKRVIEIKVIGQMDNTIDNTFESANRVYDVDGLSPTVNTCGGGGLQPKVIVASRGRNPENPSDRTPGNYVEQRLEPNEEGKCNTLTTVQKDNLLLTPNNWKHKAGDGTKTRSRRISEIHPALQANTGASQQTYLAETPYRIRKLTPKECWRLTGISNEDFHKAEQVNSNTQLYKQAGNAIVVSVLEAIFCLMNIQSCPTWEEYAKERYL